VGSGAGGGWDVTTLVIGNDHDPCDELDSVMLELARTGGTGPSRGGGFAVRGDGRRGQGGGLGGNRFGRDRDNDSDACRPKITFPSFDGESDPLPCLNKCATYFRAMGTLADERVWMASLYLDRVAAKWYYALEPKVA
jgi:hypothetical protein